MKGKETKKKESGVQRERERGGSGPLCGGLGIWNLLEQPVPLHEARNMPLAWRCGYSANPSWI